MAIFAFPSVAAAQPIVPPGNSAASQYTEAFSTAGGNARVGHRGKRAHRSPVKVLGSRNARRLEAAGPQGRAVAEVVAATAPATGVSGHTGRGPQAHGEGPAGSSGLGKVIGEATGSSDSGELGILLPLLIACALVGSAVYFWRHKQRAT